MTIDPNHIQLSPEQRQQIAVVAEHLGKSWEEVLANAIAGLPTHEDLLAINASVRDLEGGEAGRSFDEFATDFRAKNGISEQ